MLRPLAVTTLCGVLAQATTLPCGHDCHATQASSSATSQHPCHADAESGGTADRLAPAPASCGHSHGEQDSAVAAAKGSDAAGSNLMVAVVTIASGTSVSSLDTADRLHRPTCDIVPPAPASYTAPLRI